MATKKTQPAPVAPPAPVSIQDPDVSDPEIVAAYLAHMRTRTERAVGLAQRGSLEAARFALQHANDALSNALSCGMPRPAYEDAFATLEDVYSSLPALAAPAQRSAAE